MEQQEPLFLEHFDFGSNNVLCFSSWSQQALSAEEKLCDFQENAQRMKTVPQGWKIKAPLSLADKERQRRTAMKTLCSSLISLLPPQDRKRSLADRLQLATDYIHSLKARVSDLQKELEEMKSREAMPSYAGKGGVHLDWDGLVPAAKVRRLNASYAELFVDGVQRGTSFSRILQIVHDSGSSIVSVSSCNLGHVDSITVLLKVCENFNAERLCAQIEATIQSELAGS